jgi:hypothetical protein
MPTYYAWPESARFGKTIPKSKIYEHASITTKLKDLFIEQVEQIVWSYKLAPETINIPATQDVPEIQVFSVVLKTGEIKLDVLACIDDAIPFPIIFEIEYEGHIQLVAAYKRPSATESGKWVTGTYIQTAWFEKANERVQVPLLLNLEALYAGIFTSITDIPMRKTEQLRVYAVRIEDLHLLQREKEKLESMILREKQFNLKIELNHKLRELVNKIKHLEAINAGNS